MNLSNGQERFDAVDEAERATGDKKNWRDLIKNLNVEAQLSAAGAPPWVTEFLRKAATVGADAYSSAGEKLGKTLNTVHLPVTISKEILKEVAEGLLDSYSLEVKAKVEFKKKKKSESEEGDLP